MPNSTKTPVIDVTDPMFFYTDSYVDYLVAESIGEFYNKSWLRSIEAQKGKVNSRVKMISIGIDDEINRRYGYPILNGRAFEPTDVLVGKYEGNIFPYYNKKEFLDRYGYDKEIPLRALLTDTEIFSMRLNVVTFDGYSEFEGVYFIAQRDGTSLIVMKDPKSITKYFWKKKMIDKDPSLLLTAEFLGSKLFGTKKPGVTNIPNNEDFAEYMNSNFFLRVFTEPHGSVYYYNGLAQNLIKKVQYQGKPHAAIPISKLDEILHIEKPNDTNAYSLYIGYEKNDLLVYSLNGSTLFISNGYLVFQGNEFIDDIIPYMETSTLTSTIQLYIFDEYQKTGSESLYIKYSDADPKYHYPSGTIPYRKNISHPDNIRCYRKNVADFYWSRDPGNAGLAHKTYGAVVNTPHLYWRYDGPVETPGYSISDSGEDIILSYMKKYDQLRPSDAKNRTDKGTFVAESYRDEVYDAMSVIGAGGIEYVSHIQYPNVYHQSAWNTYFSILNLFGPIHRGWSAYPQSIEYYEADPAIVQTEWLDPYKYQIDYDSDFVTKYLKTEAAKIDTEANKRGIADWRGNLLWKWNYDFDDYMNSKHYGNLRAYQLSKFAELYRDNPTILDLYLTKVEALKWRMRSYTIHYDDVINEQHRVPVMTTEFIHPNPEDRYHFDKPQLWVESTTTDTFGRFIEVFVNGYKIKTNLSCAVNYTNYVFFDADLVPAGAEVIVDLCKYPDDEFLRKRTGSFTLTSTTVPVQFPAGFGKTNLNSLVFYNKATGEILDINDLGLIFTEKKDQFEVENMIGEVENVVTTPGLADISYLRTNMKEFYKTVDVQKIILSTSRIDINIPVNPSIPWFSDTEIDLDNVVVSTDKLEGLGIDIAVTTTDNHFVHYQQISSTPSGAINGSFTIPNWVEFGAPNHQPDQMNGRFHVYLAGRLLPSEFIKIDGPYDTASVDTATEHSTHYMGGSLKITYALKKTNVPLPNGTTSLIIEYIPYSFGDRNEAMVYPDTHISGPIGSISYNYRNGTLIDTGATHGCRIFASGLRLSDEKIHPISQKNCDMYYFDHVPAGARLDITRTIIPDIHKLLGDVRISGDIQQIPEGNVDLDIPLMEALPNHIFMMGGVNQYTYQMMKTKRISGKDVFDMTDPTQWTFLIHHSFMPVDYIEQYGRVEIQRDIPGEDLLQPYEELIYNSRTSIVSVSVKPGDPSPGLKGFLPNVITYGLLGGKPITKRLVTTDTGASPATLPLNIRRVTEIEDDGVYQEDCLEMMIIYRKGHPLKLNLPSKVFNLPLDLATLKITALSGLDTDFYDIYKKTTMPIYIEIHDPFVYYAAIISPEDLKANDMTLTDDIVFKHIKAFSKWTMRDNTAIVIEIRGAASHEITDVY